MNNMKKLTSEELIDLVNSLYGIIDHWETIFYLSEEEEDQNPETLVFKSFSNGESHEEMHVSVEDSFVDQSTLKLVMLSEELTKADGAQEEFTMLKPYVYKE